MSRDNFPRQFPRQPGQNRLGGVFTDLSHFIEFCNEAIETFLQSFRLVRDGATTIAAMANLATLSLCILLFVIGSVCAKEYTPAEQCGKEKLFKNVAVYSSRGLCKKMPCEFKLGENLKVELEFKNQNRVEKIVAKCKANALGNNIDFPIPDAENGCNHLTVGKCPVQPNTDLEIVYNIPVKPPVLMEDKLAVNVKLQFSLEDQNKEMISCFQISAKVQL